MDHLIYWANRFQSGCSCKLEHRFNPIFDNPSCRRFTRTRRRMAREMRSPMRTTPTPGTSSIYACADATRTPLVSSTAASSRRRSPSRELRRPLIDERRHAFLLVVEGEQGVEQTALQHHALGQW